jgi:SHS2 domain-containing protein
MRDRDLAAMPPEPPSARFEDHVGELALTIEAGSLEELFVEAARVVSRECGETRDAPGPWETVALAARDQASLLVDWLNELIGRSEVQGRAYGDVRGLAITGPGSSFAGDGPARLTAEVRGQPVLTWESALKAATYHGLELERSGGRCRARVLFDV